MQLAEFILNKVRSGETPLSNNEGIPNIGGKSFEEFMLQERFDDILMHVKEIGITNLDIPTLLSELSRYNKICNEIESKFKESLEKIALNYVMEFLACNSELSKVEAKLQSKIEFKRDIPLTPEGFSNHPFDSIEESDMVTKVIRKRLLLNTIIQGAAYEAMLGFITNSNKIAKKYTSNIFKLDRNLLKVYSRIIALNDLLLFLKEEEITDKKHMQGSYVEVKLGNRGYATVIEAQALNLPYLIMELFKGFGELFLAHGLPRDDEKAEFILNHTDFLLAEPWNLRYGVPMFEYVSRLGWSPSLYPYIMMTLAKIPVNDFNSQIKEILANTRVGNNIMTDIINECKELRDNQKSYDDVDTDDFDNSLILNDSYFETGNSNGEEDTDIIQEFDQ